MLSANPPAPSNLLLSEIDILLARMRLLELCIKQAEARAVYDRTRADEQYQAEVANLRGALAESELKYTTAQAAARQTEANLIERLDTLEKQLAESRHQLEQRYAELKASETEAVGLRGQIARLENFRQQAQDSITEAEERYRELQLQLADRQKQLDEQNHESERVRVSFSAELARLQAALAEREQMLAQEKSAAAQVQDTLTTEIVTLRSQLDQKQELVDFRNDELREANRQITAFQERIEELESATQLAATQAQDLQNARLAYEAEIDKLHQELTHERDELSERKSALGRIRNENLTLCEQIEQQKSIAAAELAAHLSADQARLKLEAENHELNARLLQEQQALLAAENRTAAKTAELRAAIAGASEQRDAALAAQQVQQNAIAQLSIEISQVREQLDQQKVLATQTSQELARMRSQKAALDEGKIQAERLQAELEQRCREMAAELQQVQAGLQVKNDQLEAALSAAQTFQTQSDSTVHALQLQLAQSQLVAESRATEIADLKARVSHLVDRLAESDSSNIELKQLQISIESDRNELNAKAAALGNQYQLEQQSLANELSKEREIVGLLTEQLRAAEQRIIALTDEARAHREKLETVSLESPALRSRLDELQALYESERASAEQARLKFETEAASLRQELQGKTWTSAQQQAALENLALGHRNQVQKLDGEIAELQNCIADRNLALDKSQSQIRGLEQRLETLVGELQQAEHASIDRAVELKQQYGLRIADLERQLVRKGSELQERENSQSKMEQTLRQELERLVHDIQEKNHILQNRNDELVRVKAAMDALQERLTEAETTSARLKNTAAAESETMRVEFQAQLALLQAELSEKDWALQERQVTSLALEQNYRQELDSLRHQLEEQANQKVAMHRELVFGQVSAPQFLPSAPACGNGDDLRARGHLRRWPSGFGRKRRWKLA